MIRVFEKTYFYFFVLLLFFYFNSFSQIKTVGTPYVTSFTKTDYKAGRQNWDIVQDNDGFMYFANNKGVLVYDGANWDLYPIKNSIVRSLCAGKDGAVFVGADSEFGVLKKDSLGKIQYTSFSNLMDSLPKTVNIWSIACVDDKVLFRSKSFLFVYSNNTLQHFYFSDGITGIISHRKNIYLLDGLGSIFKCIIQEKHNEVKFEYICNNSLLQHSEIRKMIVVNDYILIATLNKGLFTFKDGSLKLSNINCNDFLIQNRIFSCDVLNGGYLSFGTILNGLIITDLQGNIIHHFNSKNGLYNNTVLSLFFDRENNLWAGLDDGITYVETNSPFSKYFEGAAGYVAKEFNGKIYLGTNQGLFEKPIEDHSETLLVEEVKAQVWDLQIIDNQLFCSDNEGFLTIDKNNNKKRIFNVAGGEGIAKLDDKLLIASTYEDLFLLQKKNDIWETKCKVKGYKEGGRNITRFGDKIILNTGRVKILEMNNTFDSVVSVETCDSLTNIFYGFGTVFYDGSNFFNYQQGKLKRNKYLSNMFNQHTVNYLTELPNGDVWFIENEQLGFISRNDIETKNYVKENLELKGGLIDNFKYLYALDDNNIIVGTAYGFLHYDAKYEKKNKLQYNTFINKIEALSNTNSVLFSGHYSDSNWQLPVRTHCNNIRFYYNTPFYGHKKKVQYYSKLEGFDDEWKHTENTFKEYFNLPPKTYIFKVKAIDIYNYETSVTEIKLVVLPSWYNNWFSYVLYVLFLCFSIYYLSIWTYKRKHRLELKKKKILEQKLTLLKNEQLKAEVNYKTRKLANFAKGIVLKNEFLNTIKNEIKQNTINANFNLKTIIRKIENNIKNKEEEKVFEESFNQVHEDFLKKLNEKHPNLSPAEIRICTYLRMNLSNKKISSLRNISTKSVEVIRSRIRKKMKLESKTNLVKYIMDI